MTIDTFRTPEIPETNYECDVIEGNKSKKLCDNLNNWLDRHPLIEIENILLLDKYARQGSKPWKILLIYKKISNNYDPGTRVLSAYITDTESNGLRQKINQWFIKNPLIEIIKTMELLYVRDNDERTNGIFIFYKTKK